MKSPAAAPISTNYFRLEGGLNLVTPALSVPAGQTIDSQNFVPEVTGGYKRVGGYERFDGRTSPSERDYYVATVALSGVVAVGNTITGLTSGATAKVIAVESATVLAVTRVTGTFVAESIQVSAVTVGTVSAVTLSGASTTSLAASYESLTADEYRTDISAVPGSGPIRGVWLYRDDVYAFRDNAGGTACEMYKSTSSGWSASLHTFAVPGGTFRFVNWNFSGASTGQKMYGCDGKNKAFEFDGTTLTAITTTAATDTPQCIIAHKNRLFLSIFGSLFFSAAGTPTTGWANVAGTSGEIGVSDQITGLLAIPGDQNASALAIYARNSTYVLYGSSASSFILQTSATDAGALAGSMQFIGSLLALDDRGVTQLQTAQNFSNLEQATISRLVQPFLEARRGLFVTSTVLRSQNHYRIYFSDGYCLAFQIENKSNRGVMPIYYPNPVTCICSGENLSGVEKTYFGSTNGMVYQAEVGKSFDGSDIEAWMRLSFDSERSPRIRKRWRRVVVECRVPQYTSLNFTYSLDYGDFTLPVAPTSISDVVQTKLQPGGGGFWDQFTWDNWSWDNSIISPPSFDLTGTSKNISMLVYTLDRVSDPFTLQSITLHYSPRRVERA